MRNRVKTTFSILLCLIYLPFQGQESIPVTRYVFEVKFPLPTNDSTSTKELIEIAYLDVNQNKSRFASKAQLEKEQITMDYNTGSKAQSSNAEFAAALKGSNTKLDFMVFKQEGQLSTLLKSGMDFYMVQEPMELIQWQIYPQVEDYYGMEVQRATGSYANRTWDVWFTQEIPLIEGPYKFKNLPGFVVKAVDSTHQWSFELIEADPGFTTYWIPRTGDRAMQVNKKQYLKIKNNNAKKNIGQFLEQNSPHNQVRIFDSSGKEATQSFMNHKLKVNTKAIELD